MTDLFMTDLFACLFRRHGDRLIPLLPDEAIEALGEEMLIEWERLRHQSLLASGDPSAAIDKTQPTASAPTAPFDRKTVGLACLQRVVCFLLLCELQYPLHSAKAGGRATFSDFLPPENVGSIN